MIALIVIKRIYDDHSPCDGFRILVDRLWPRGVSKADANVGLWLKEIAPSDHLRRWFSHDPKKWGHFKKKYKEELKENKALLEKIKNLEKEHKIITLIFSAKDEQHNNAVVLGEILHYSSRTKAGSQISDKHHKS